MLGKLLRRENEVVPEALVAYKWRIPAQLKVSIKPSQDEGYVAFIEDFPGCVTQGDTGQEVFEMVNDCLYTYLEIPENYRMYMPTFLPPERVRQHLNIEIPKEFIRDNLVLERA